MSAGRRTAEAKPSSGDGQAKFESPYPLPHNESEKRRLALQHQILFHLLGAKYFAPVTEILEPGARVLDAGCGPGVWTLDMAKTFPRSSFQGLDLASNFLQHDLQNVRFDECNMLDGLPFPDAHFDYVFSRFLIWSVREDQWEFYVKELLRVTRPGGYIELMEGKFLTDGGPAWKRISGSILSYMRSKGMNPDTPFTLPMIFEATGEVTDIHYHEKEIVVGPKSNEWEHKYFEDLIEVFDTMTPALAPLVELTTDQYEAVIEEFRLEYQKYYSKVKMVVTHAHKKPLIMGER